MIPHIVPLAKPLLRGPKSRLPKAVLSGHSHPFHLGDRPLPLFISWYANACVPINPDLLGTINTTALHQQEAKKLNGRVSLTFVNHTSTLLRELEALPC